jgi:hypothetical protein
MIRGVTSGRRKGGRGKTVVPGVIDENTIETNEGGDVPTVGPGERSIPERQLIEG